MTNHLKLDQFYQPKGLAQGEDVAEYLGIAL